MVCGAIAYASSSPFIIIIGYFTALCYLQEKVKPYALPYLSRLENPIFHQGNARPHVARANLNFFEVTHVNFFAMVH